MATHAVARVSELPPGHRKIVTVDGRSIGVFNVDGRFYALRNACPHQGAPLCQGSLGGTAAASRPGEYIWEREGEILVCPWHGWEFDVTTGRSIVNPHRIRVRSYQVSVEQAVPGENPVPGEHPAFVGITSPADEDERVLTFPVTVDDGAILLHL